MHLILISLAVLVGFFVLLKLISSPKLLLFLAVLGGLYFVSTKRPEIEKHVNSLPNIEKSADQLVTTAKKAVK